MLIGPLGKQIYGPPVCNTDFDDKLACLNLSGVEWDFIPALISSLMNLQKIYGFNEPFRLQVPQQAGGPLMVINARYSQKTRSVIL